MSRSFQFKKRIEDFKRKFKTSATKWTFVLAPRSMSSTKRTFYLKTKSLSSANRSKSSLTRSPLKPTTTKRSPDSTKNSTISPQISPKLLPILKPNFLLSTHRSLKPLPQKSTLWKLKLKEQMLNYTKLKLLP